MPRPSSPVYAKASTNCPYLTLENPHHQRQYWNSVVVDVPGTSVRWILLVQRMRPSQRRPKAAPLTQLDNLVVIDTRLTARRAEARRSIEAHAATASISRTHSQCQRGAERPNIRGRGREILVFIPGKEVGGAYRDRTDDLKLAKLALSQLS